VQALLIIFCVIAAIGGAHVSWWLTDTAIARMDVEPAEWVARRWRAYRARPAPRRARA
jgi:hypothetical protein